MKSIALTALAVVVLFFTSASSAAAQQSGSLQVTARVVDGRASWSGVSEAQSGLAGWSRGETDGTRASGLVQVRVREERARSGALTPDRLAIRVDYLRN